MRCRGDFFRFPRFFRTARCRAPDHADALEIALAAVRARRASTGSGSRCERSEESEKRVDPAATVGDKEVADPLLCWRLRNAERLRADDLARGRDAGGWCAEHRRCLSWPEQRRGACSWCVPVDPEREPAYWASHWRRFTERG